MLRILFSRLGMPHIGPPTAFAFNVPPRTATGSMQVDKGKGKRIVVREVVNLGGLLDRLVDSGESVIVVEHLAAYVGT